MNILRFELAAVQKNLELDAIQIGKHNVVPFDQFAKSPETDLFLLTRHAMPLFETVLSKQNPQVWAGIASVAVRTPPGLTRSQPILEGSFEQHADATQHLRFNHRLS